MRGVWRGQDALVPARPVCVQRTGKRPRSQVFRRHGEGRAGRGCRSVCCCAGSPPHSITLTTWPPFCADAQAASVSWITRSPQMAGT